MPPLPRRIDARPAPPPASLIPNARRGTSDGADRGGATPPVRPTVPMCEKDPEPKRLRAS